MIEAPIFIYLDGDIDATSPKLLANALASIGERRVYIQLNSLGGNLLAGMELGRIIRKYGASTSVGKYRPGNSTGESGVCYSACALAFLGADYRYIQQGSEYGVHRFVNPAGPKTDDLAIGQILSAAIGNYIREMGVDSALFELTVKAGASEIYLLSKDELEKLRVVNNGRLPPAWTIEAIEGGMYLRGFQETWVGKGKSIFSCVNKELVFYSVYTAGDKSDSIAQGQWVHFLDIDGHQIPLDAPFDLFNDKGYLNAFFRLTPAQFRMVSSARRSVGHSMQITRDAQMYVGYHVDIDASSTQRIKNFITNCTASR